MDAEHPSPQTVPRSTPPCRQSARAPSAQDRDHLTSSCTTGLDWAKAGAWGRETCAENLGGPSRAGRCSGQERLSQRRGLLLAGGMETGMPRALDKRSSFGALLCILSHLEILRLSKSELCSPEWLLSCPLPSWHGVGVPVGGRCVGVAAWG